MASLKLKFWQKSSPKNHGDMMADMAGHGAMALPDISSVPFKWRLKARWEGYDDPVEYYMLQQELDAYRNWLRKMLVYAARPVEEELPDLDLDDEIGNWPPERLKLYAKLFDRGIMKPGGHDYAMELAKPLALDETMSCLEIGARIGGAARLLADKFGVWVTALEQDGELALIGMDRSVTAGVQKKVPVQKYDPQNPEIRQKYFNVVYSVGEMFLIEKKDTFLLQIAESLREQGQLLLTDYVMTNKSSEQSDLYKNWLAHEEIMPHPWTAERYKDVLQKLKFDIRISKDETALHLSHIKSAWAGLAQEMKGGEIDPDFNTFLEQELEMWMRRVKLLETGELAYYRFYATHD
ncbi:cyclopropane-fatty-acyl-phospholipid synthase family protein [Thalassospira sp.]|uniref:SAM-dependent methyltransferase n=1 Tax=Thalassospira sp. TaxID=1912094 RepID=UPI002736B715|nr:methyltransferase domain-containing protein [Thalassospira sp.]MDP2698180.1 methyltransferase domain-containing protein [Thalassospira sp.]